MTQVKEETSAPVRLLMSYMEELMEQFQDYEPDADSDAEEQF